MAVGDVPACEGDAGFDGFLSVGHAVVLLVFVFDVVQNLYSFID